MPYEMNTGYLLDEERNTKYQFLSSIPEDLSLADVGDIPDSYLPDTRMENQARMNSCVGHGLSTCQEHLAENGLKANKSGQETYGKMPQQFSRMFAYLTSQERSSIQGDRGAFIQGAVEAYLNDGCIDENKMPYPNSYVSHISQTVREEAKKILGIRYFKATPDPYDACRHIHLRRAILLGIPWKESFANEQDGIISTVQGRTLGGHAVCSIGYKKIGNDWYPRLTNSHGSRWAKAGHAYVHPKVWEWMINNGVVVVLEGLTLDPDVVDWSDPTNNPFA